METYFVGIGPMEATTYSKDFDKCMERCRNRWGNNAYGWFILKMTKEQLYILNKEHTYNIDQCEIVWDDFNIAPTEKQLEFRKSIIFVKPLKSI